MATTVRRGRTSEAREVSLRHIREAGTIFIAYASHDLAKARDIRRRVVRLRKAASAASVFLAAESLPTGEPVSPEVVEKALRESDLAIFVCGRQTHNSLWVAREVALARSSGVRILPILLHAGVQPPEGLDFAIQGIHLTHLFPAIRYLRLTVLVLVAIALGAASWFGWSTYRARSDLARSDIASWIDLDGTRAPSAIDISRYQQLLEQETQAARWGHEDLRRQLESSRAQMLDPELRRVVLQANSERTDLETDPYAGLVWVGETTRLEAWPRRGVAVQDLDLGALALEGAAEASERSEFRSSVVRRARLYDLRFNPIHGRVVAEVEYDGPARQPEGQRLEQDPEGWLVLDGMERIEGNEREAMVLEPPGDPRSLGLTRYLVGVSSSNPLGEQTGGSEDWYELGREESREERLATTIVGSRYQPILRELLLCMYEYEQLAFPEVSDPDSEGDEDVTPDFRHTRLFRLAVDPSAGRELVEIEHAVDPYGLIQDLNPELRITFAVLFGGDRAVRVTTAEQYHPRAKYIYFEDAWEEDQEQDAEGPPPCVLPKVEESGSLRPERSRYTPAALHIGARRALAGDRLLDLDTGEIRLLDLLTDDEDEIAVAWFTTSGDLLIVTRIDGSIDAIRAIDGVLLHRFVCPSWVKDATVSADGAELWLLLENGQVESWPLDAFGSDGWRPRKPSDR